jgi:hypothetical protein
LVLHYWLHRDGLPSDLRIGVRLEDGVLHAHAWVELEGQAVNEVSSALAAFVSLGHTRRHGNSGSVNRDREIMATAGNTVGRTYEQGA